MLKPEQQSPMLGNVDTSPPPQYFSYPSDEQAAEHDRFWDETHPWAWRKGDQTAIFRFSNGIGQPHKDFSLKNDKRQGKWEVVLRVWARNIPRLMRAGFNWTEANIQHEKGYVKLNHVSWFSWYRLYYGIKHMRLLHLKDMSPDREWFATLTLFAADFNTISDFHVGWLSQQNTAYVKVDDHKGDLVYLWDVYTGAKLNTIYPNMPLKGWWPWPKEEDCFETD
jgi:hypothetical protein